MPSEDQRERQTDTDRETDRQTQTWCNCGTVDC